MHCNIHLLPQGIFIAILGYNFKKRGLQNSAYVACTFKPICQYLPRTNNGWLNNNLVEHRKFSSRCRLRDGVPRGCHFTSALRYACIYKHVSKVHIALYNYFKLLILWARGANVQITVYSYVSSLPYPYPTKWGQYNMFFIMLW
jgi:hypothetical protein